MAQAPQASRKRTQLRGSRRRRKDGGLPHGVPNAARRSVSVTLGSSLMISVALIALSYALRLGCHPGIRLSPFLFHKEILTTDCTDFTDLISSHPGAIRVIRG